MTITVDVPAKQIKSIQDLATEAKGSTVAVGAPIGILNISRHDARTAESLTEPTDMSENYRPLTAFGTPHDEVIYITDSLEVWIYSEVSITVAIEEL